MGDDGSILIYSDLHDLFISYAWIVNAYSSYIETLSF